MAPDEVKLLKPNPAGCWHCVPAIMHGLDALCGPTVFPAIGPVSVSGTAVATPVNANNDTSAPVRFFKSITLHLQPFAKLMGEKPRRRRWSSTIFWTGTRDYIPPYTPIALAFWSKSTSKSQTREPPSD